MRQSDGIMLGRRRGITGELASSPPRRAMSLLTEPPRCSPCALQATPELRTMVYADAKSSWVLGRVGTVSVDGSGGQGTEQFRPGGARCSSECQIWALFRSNPVQ